MITLEKRIRLQQYGIGLLRIVVGAILMAHGAQKLFELGLSGTAGAFARLGIPLPTASAAVVMTVELLGGLALALGFLTRLAAVPLAVTMLVAMLAVHLPGGSSCRTGSSSRWPCWPVRWPCCSPARERGPWTTSSLPPGNRCWTGRRGRRSRSAGS